MGKKSRKKRERKLKGKRPKTGRHTASPFKDVDASFVHVTQKLRGILARYCAEDVILAGTISELWMPNITSQVKHQLLLRVAVSMPPHEYRGAQPLALYEDFRAFLLAVYAALPSFPMLEDYVPEPDWGEVSLDVRAAFLPVMYGGSVERVTDFVTAFRMTHAGNFPAAHDMDVALWIQSYLITHVHSQPVHTQPDARPLDIELGHLEVPPQAFWENCGAALLSAGAEVTQALGAFSKNLTVDLGTLCMPESSAAFGESIMDGSSLPALTVRVKDTLLPLSPRSGPGAVVEQWANRMIGTKDEQLRRLAYALSDFLSDRFRQDDVATGPLIPGTPEKLLPYFLAGAFVAGDKLYLVAPGNIQDPPSVLRMCRNIRALVSSARKWAFKHAENNTGIQLLRRNGQPFLADDVAFLIVPIDVTTQMRMLPDVGKQARIVPLSDFVGVFDSLKDVTELGSFLAYIDRNRSLVLSPFAGFTDLFGSFRDSHGLLVDGAVQPTMISLDPHWGSNWRFKQLSEFWRIAPHDFPNGKSTWIIDSENGSNLYQMMSKGQPALSWSTVIGHCSVHVVLPFVPDMMDATNGNLLETFTHCAADALSQRREIIAVLPIFRRPRIVFVCRPERSTFVEEDVHTVAAGALEKPLIDKVKVVSTDTDDRIVLSIEVNMSRVQQGIHDATDASFESACAIELLRCVAAATGERIDVGVVDQIASTSKGRPRFVLQQLTRDVDVPDRATPMLPEPGDYKLARRDLAVVFRDGNAQPGRYELAEAKVIIDRARDVFRGDVHKRLATCDLVSLLVFCIEQHDALIAEYHRTTTRVQISLTHDVNYSRAEVIAKAHDRFTRNARNYRYIIEAALSLAAGGETTGSARMTVDVVAAVDWLFVLYGASDVLHNGVHPGGVDLDQQYVPEIFFSDDVTKKEHEFSLEQANLKIGVELAHADEIHGLKPGSGLMKIDQAFSADLGFTLSNLGQCLITLSRWASATSTHDLKLSYQASVDDIVAVLCRVVEGLEEEEARCIVGFITVDPTHIRQLLGKNQAESDVPVWEHNKRAQRLTIRPLVPLSTGKLLWGAACAERAGRIWIGSVSDGYLPAAFVWPTVRPEVRNIKEGIEKELERRAHEICARAAPYVSPDIDFIRRFPEENFEDAGDFDVLAYWPETNRWLAVECKYNQPPFCLKDARRLRDRIFGTGRDHGQFEKIERRHRFLGKHMGRLRELLRWPASTTNRPPSIVDVYVGRDIYWWMRNPPYEVTAHFVRIDALDGWLRAEGFLRT
ncbi:MAG: hypothetical protein EPN36_13330 [Rhodanobacteraceae bacterium]|nr:MAG: hypothetical protein EPN36_13330 [Rhodanobacteraceae bacterium]